MVLSPYYPRFRLENGETPMAWQKSDCLIVVKKPVKAGGAKGAANSRSQSGNRHSRERLALDGT